tara:strand:+ start:378 stop:536 length:159 start_codon:yes stop_codon:yes gene_type:complete
MKKKTSYWVSLTDPETLKDLPLNPDLDDPKKKLLLGDFLKKIKQPKPTFPSS